MVAHRSHRCLVRPQFDIAVAGGTTRVNTLKKKVRWSVLAPLLKLFPHAADLVPMEYDAIQQKLGRKYRSRFSPANR
jgi:hypothetical protein